MKLSSIFFISAIFVTVSTGAFAAPLPAYALEPTSLLERDVEFYKRTLGSDPKPILKSSTNSAQGKTEKTQKKVTFADNPSIKPFTAKSHEVTNPSRIVPYYSWSGQSSNPGFSARVATFNDPVLRSTGDHKPSPAPSPPPPPPPPPPPARKPLKFVIPKSSKVPPASAVKKTASSPPPADVDNHFIHDNTIYHAGHPPPIRFKDGARKPGGPGGIPGNFPDLAMPARQRNPPSNQ